MLPYRHAGENRHPEILKFLGRATPDCDPGLPE